MAQTVKNLPATQETQVGSPGHEDPLEKGMATHSSILAWRIPWRSLVGYSSWGCRVEHNLATEHTSKEQLSVYTDQDKDT